MEDFPSYENKSYYTCKINQIIGRYNQLFCIFGYLLRDRFGLKNNDIIVDIQRGFTNNNNQIFWNYFGATHNILGELSQFSGGVNQKFTHRCVRFIFGSGKSITISTNSYSDKMPEGVVSLDKFYLGLENFEREIFDRILSQINRIESEYFHSKSYQSTIQGIRTLSRDKIFKELNITESTIN